jgi:hypothetical protein
MPTTNLQAVLLFVLIFAAPALFANDPTQEQPDAHIDPAVIENLLTPDHSLLDIIDTDMAAGCCKVCRKGKACGDSCISRKYSCTRGKGCACDG